MAKSLRQSSIYSFLRCPYQYHLRDTDPSSQRFQHPAAVFGTAVHDVIHQLHSEDWDLDLEVAYLEAFERATTKRQIDTPTGRLGVQATTSTERQFDNATVPIRWKDEDKEREQYRLDALAMLEGYRSKDYNRTCRVLLAEATFTVKIGRQTITGTIDQLREHPDGTLELVDFKTSKSCPPQSYLVVDYQLALYSWALKHGTFLVDGKLVQPNVSPDELTLYFLRHHIPYKRATGGKLAGDERGDPRITTTRSTEQLKALKTDVASVAKMMRLGLFPRSPDPMKCGVCGYQQACKGSACDAQLPKARLETLKQELENVA